ncbi:unnamed protein product [Hermetia illucens]|uniref:Dynein heavy chain tail domain-containing protein n=1 Tax=Hermetia illucens TaxID=343691 RepID=A0A7R8YTJ5_HERIL|nr:unnamed protein product [Hermetia illucens]
MEDVRLIWLKQTIANLLGVYEPEYVHTLVEENSDQIHEFFDEEYTQISDIHKRVMYAWRTFYDKLVEEEITVLEKLPPPTPPPEPEKKERKGKKKDAKGKGKGKAKDTDTQAPAESGKGSPKKKGKGKKGKKGKGKTVLVEPPAEAEPVYVEVKKIVQSYVKTPILHCHFGPMESADIDPKIKYIYIVRKNPNDIPLFSNINECFAELPQFFIVGSMKGNLIMTMKSVVQAYKQAIEFQFREPTITEAQKLDFTIVEKIAETEQPGLVDFAKPSQFRLKAVKAKKKMEQDDVSAKSEYAESIAAKSGVTEEPSESEATLSVKLTISERWDKLLKETTKQAEEYYKRLETVELEKPPMQAQLHKNMEKFIEGIDWTMSHIVWAFNLPTAYFAPGQEDIQFEDAKIRIAIDPKKAKLEEFSNQQLEDVANGWRTHIRRILKDFKDKQPEEFTPMAEFKLWRDQELEMYSILEQLKTSFVTLVLERLRSVNSQALSGWEDFVTEIEEYHLRAKENSDFLSTITEYLEASFSFFGRNTSMLNDKPVSQYFPQDSRRAYFP